MKHIEIGHEGEALPVLCERVFDVRVIDGLAIFSERCDDCFGFCMPKEDAIEMLNEMIEYIKEEELK